MLSFADVKLACLGALGAFIAAWAQRKTLVTFWDFVIYVVAGAAFSQWCTSLVILWLDKLKDHSAGVGFLLGMFGGSIAAMIFRTLSTMDLWGLIRSKFGGNSSNG